VLPVLVAYLHLRAALVAALGAAVFLPVTGATLVGGLPRALRKATCAWVRGEWLWLTAAVALADEQVAALRDR
jgi:hypothetical protein